MTRPSAEIRRQVVERARSCCEYCLVHQDFVASTHQVDHVIAETHRGRTTMDNLALSCTLCNRRKGSDITSVDPGTAKSFLSSIREPSDGRIISKWTVSASLVRV